MTYRVEKSIANMGWAQNLGSIVQYMHYYADSTVNQPDLPFASSLTLNSISPWTELDIYLGL